MKDNVYIVNSEIYKYDNSNIFNPKSMYLEGLDINIKSDSKIYESIRNLLIFMELDKENIGTSNWNPFKDFIKEGNKVVIKPNLVKHINGLKDTSTDCLITNFAIIRPIIDYTIKALNGTGEIIVGDAPVQECIFSEVIKLNGLEDAIKKYNESGYNVKLMDFRKNNNEDLECILVKLNENSSFIDIDAYADKYAITNYDLRKMKEHHCNGIHEYLFPKDVLEADVIINIPKPKTHRKAGMTACMKNFVGVNSKKEYLPHHRNGNIHDNGDEYPEKSTLKHLQSSVKNYTYKKSKLISLTNKSLLLFEKIFKKDRFIEGSWYGNDTIWRTIIDINKIILYANKTGMITNKKQRIIFNIADMIISGEKEGPLLPSPKKVGLIIAGFNQLNTDNIIAEIMGFDMEKIKYIKNGYMLNNHLISISNKFDSFLLDKDNNKIKLDENEFIKLNKKFIPTDGWIDYLK